MEPGAPSGAGTPGYGTPGHGYGGTPPPPPPTIDHRYGKPLEHKYAFRVCGPDITKWAIDHIVAGVRKGDSAPNKLSVQIPLLRDRIEQLRDESRRLGGREGELRTILESKKLTRDAIGWGWSAAFSGLKAFCPTNCPNTVTFSGRCIHKNHADHILIMGFIVREFGADVARTAGVYNENPSQVALAGEVLANIGLLSKIDDVRDTDIYETARSAFRQGDFRDGESFSDLAFNEVAIAWASAMLAGVRAIGLSYFNGMGPDLYTDKAFRKAGLNVEEMNAIFTFKDSDGRDLRACIPCASSGISRR